MIKKTYSTVPVHSFIGIYYVYKSVLLAIRLKGYLDFKTVIA